ncbi:MAG TPA: hypothetical protein VMK12_24105 [Anaeromyxobacteraceae bacterium]|nr:hypothetical protein [Anaeromyxobacteraceae bacterium]
MSANGILELLPPELRRLNRMEREIALPYPAVLEAIDVLQARGVLLLGWEPLASYPDAGFGTYPAMGIGGLAGMGQAAGERFKRIHPELSEDAVRALSWCYTYDYK